MIKLIVPLALLLLATLYKIWRDYEGDPKKAALDVALLLFLVGATLFGRYLRIYMPLLLLHIVLLIVAWIGYYLYLFGGRRRLWVIFSPLLSIALFFALGYFEKVTQ